MDFRWTDEQLALRDTVANFARQELNVRVPERDRQGQFRCESWKSCAEFGILGLPMPQRYGGTAEDIATVVLAMEALGYACKDNGLTFGLGAQMWSVQMPLLIFGSDALKDQFLPRLVKGDLIGAHAVTEPAAGSDLFSLKTTAVRDGADYVLNGQKTFITNAPCAGLFLVLASIDRSRGAAGLTAFLLERDFPGLSVSGHLEKMGLRTSPMAEVFLSDCRVPADHILGREGGGSAVFNAAMEWERAFILAPALGSMQRIFEQCVEYSRLRQQFGRPIAKNDAVASKIVEMQLRLDSARMLTYRTAWMKSVGRRLLHEPSQTKLCVSEALVSTCLDAMQIHGGNGYMVDFGIERELRDALASKIYSGTSEIQMRVIASYLGL